MLIAIEGIDGSGKATQTALLAERAAACGLKTASFSFPGYGKNPLGDAVGMYLNGDFGDKGALPPHLTALLFAGDRYTACDDIRKAVHTNDLVILDRYVASNLAYQGARLPPEQWGDFFAWVSAVEFGVFKLPRPDLSIYLDMPVKTARRMIAKRRQRSYTALQEDLHEKDEPYLVRCAEVYRYVIDHDIAGPWCRVPCATPDGTPLPVHDIAQAVWDVLGARRLLALPAG
jgi:dTMP kinase